MILVSACLLGCACRYDGQSKPHPLAMELARQGRAVPVCPEQLGGLTTPRLPSERQGERVVMQDGRDVTEEYRRGAAETLEHTVRTLESERYASGGFSRIIIADCGMDEDAQRVAQLLCRESFDVTVCPQGDLARQFD